MNRAKEAPCPGGRSVMWRINIDQTEPPAMRYYQHVVDDDPSKPYCVMVVPMDAETLCKCGKVVWVRGAPK